MGTLATTVFRAGVRYLARGLNKQRSKHAPLTSEWVEPDDRKRLVAHHGAALSERLEQIAAYARCGYFNMEYTAGLFIVPPDIPPN
ncbi:hypothetical protein LJR230_001243 [Trinickia sp. LjRoot230]|uniref:hypothetical protein n=1 Tax=Trinickia sp. LjRoot230 TaxID=3342288 RepID=UPI003ED09E64